jgi:hypothetical protein
MIRSTYLNSAADFSRFLSNGIWEPTLANFAGIAHLLKCNEVVGIETLNDSVGNLDFSLTDGIVTTNDGINITLTEMPDGAGIVAAQPAGKTRLVMFFGKPVSGPTGRLCMTADGLPPSSINAGYERGSTGIWKVSDGVALAGTQIGTTNGTVWIMDVLSITPGSATGMQLASYNGTTMTTPAAATAASTGAVPDIDLAGAVSTFTLGAGLNPGFLCVADLTAKPSIGFLAGVCGFMWHMLKEKSMKVLSPQLISLS